MLCQSEKWLMVMRSVCVCIISVKNTLIEKKSFGKHWNASRHAQGDKDLVNGVACCTWQLTTT